MSQSDLSPHDSAGHHARAQGAAGSDAGVDGLIAGVTDYAARATPDLRGNVWFIMQIADAYAYIRLRDLVRPLQFLRQISSVPPVRFGTAGFRPELVDDLNPARHYTAFVFVGFWMWTPLAHLMLWVWEIASFFRYRGHWSPADVLSGRVGIRHGRLVRRHGPAILPGLIAADLAAPPSRAAGPDRAGKI